MRQKAKGDTRPLLMNKDGRLNHVGGIADDLGGVDPAADANLVRLSGGP
ncbi:hypothetical protein [Sporolituus thermophilus]|uniref:Uncharacterized protein n=1 Tax=Sporolituus thermophilus DSM 23256 TaxID=1123285 RepID=A0A1G7JB38_9FIRM|nr:hypothetical protein [Sporolituus thermophilus]SDF22150.1 hypothetical protein SAMN05660235_00863 [Sporolituus thermophilus DSM 23256]